MEILERLDTVVIVAPLLSVMKSQVKSYRT